MTDKSAPPAHLSVAEILAREAEIATATAALDAVETVAPVHMQVGNAPTHQLGHVRVRDDGRVNPVDLAAFLHQVAETVTDLTGLPAGEV